MAPAAPCDQVMLKKGTIIPLVPSYIFPWRLRLTLYSFEQNKYSMHIFKKIKQGGCAGGC